MAVKHPLHCRIDEEIYNKVRAEAKGKHTLGALVEKALEAYLSADGGYETMVFQANLTASAVLRMLKEKLDD